MCATRRVESTIKTKDLLKALLRVLGDAPVSLVPMLPGRFTDAPRSNVPQTFLGTERRGGIPYAWPYVHISRRIVVTLLGSIAKVNNKVVRLTAASRKSKNGGGKEERIREQVCETKVRTSEMKYGGHWIRSD